MTARDSTSVPGAFRSSAAAVVAAAASSFDDSGNSNRILTVVTVLVVLGVALLIVSWWYWRSTRPEPEALAPLELMSTRKVRRASPEERRRVLDAVRPVNVPVGGSPAHAAEPDSAAQLLPPVDLAAMSSRELPPIDELAEPEPEPEPEPGVVAPPPAPAAPSMASDLGQPPAASPSPPPSPSQPVETS